MPYDFILDLPGYDAATAGGALQITDNGDGTATWRINGYMHPDSGGYINVFSGAIQDQADHNSETTAYNATSGLILVNDELTPQYFTYAAFDALNNVIKVLRFGPLTITGPNLTLTVADLGSGDGRWTWQGYPLELIHPGGRWTCQYSLDGNDPWDLAFDPPSDPTLREFDATINLETPLYYRIVALDAAENPVATSNVFGPIVLYAALLFAIITAQQSALAASTDTNVFSAINHGTTTYARNPSNWTQCDLSAHIVYCSRTGKGGGVATGPRTAIANIHAGGSPLQGDTIRFIGNDDTINDRIVSETIEISGTDLRVVLWDVDLPNTVKIAKVLGPNYLNYLPTIQADETQSNYVLHPCLYINSASRVYPGVCMISSSGSSVLLSRNYANPTALDLWVEPITGDSASPVCLIIGGELVALGTLSTAGAAPSIAQHHDAINTAMSSTGDTLTVLDYGPYHDYS